MNTVLTAITLVAVTGVACTNTHSSSDHQTRPHTAAAVHGKATLPVTISAEIAASTATVRFRFRRPAKNVTIELYGTDGLVVDAADARTMLTAVTTGQVVERHVRFVSPRAHANLAARVRSSVGGRTTARTVSFTVGAKLPHRKHKAIFDPTTRERIKVMPARSR